eukprot:gene3615-13700_t
MSEFRCLPSPARTFMFPIRGRLRGRRSGAGHRLVFRDVQPDPEYLDMLLGDPYKALAHFFLYEAVNNSPPPHVAPVCDDVKWANHVCALHAVVFELHIMAQTGGSLLKLLTVEARARGSQPSPATPPPHIFTCERCFTPSFVKGDDAASLMGAGRPLPTKCKLCKTLIVHTYQCSCGISTDMSEGEVDWFQNKGYSLPRRCKACRSRR